MRFKHTNLAIELELPKLVRDKIPERIKKNEGKEAIVRRAKSDSEYLHFVLKKLEEEATEVRNSKTKSDFINDICDLKELIGVLMRLKGIKKSDIERVKKLKIKEHGGFSERIIFQGVE